jgi:hypothetical protein
MPPVGDGQRDGVFAGLRPAEREGVAPAGGDVGRCGHRFGAGPGQARDGEVGG